MESVKLGKITAPVGIKGEVRVYPFTDEPTRFSDMTNLDVSGVTYDVQNVRYAKNMVIVKLRGIDTRNEAETLRGKELFLKKELLWDIPEDTYFIKDLIGLSVATKDGGLIGVLTDVIKHTAQDLYEITTTEGKTFLLPAVKEFVLDVNLTKRQMTVRLIQGLAEL